MNETFVTLSGWLGGDVSIREAAGVARRHLPGRPAPPRRYQRRTDSWEDGDTQWYAVNAWRALARELRAVPAPGRPGRGARQAERPRLDQQGRPRGDHVRGRGRVRRPRPQPRHQRVPKRRKAAASPRARTPARRSGGAARGSRRAGAGGAGGLTGAGRRPDRAFRAFCP